MMVYTALPSHVWVVSCVPLKRDTRGMKGGRKVRECEGGEEREQACREVCVVGGRKSVFRGMEESVVKC